MAYYNPNNTLQGWGMQQANGDLSGIAARMAQTNLAIEAAPLQRDLLAAQARGINDATSRANELQPYEVVAKALANDKGLLEYARMQDEDEKARGLGYNSKGDWNLQLSNDKTLADIASTKASTRHTNEVTNNLVDDRYMAQVFAQNDDGSYINIDTIMRLNPNLSREQAINLIGRRTNGLNQMDAKTALEKEALRIERLKAEAQYGGKGGNPNKTLSEVPIASVDGEEGGELVSQVSTYKTYKTHPTDDELFALDMDNTYVQVALNPNDPEGQFINMPLKDYLKQRNILNGGYSEVIASADSKEELDRMTGMSLSSANDKNTPKKYTYNPETKKYDLNVIKKEDDPNNRVYRLRAENMEVYKRLMQSSDQKVREGATKDYTALNKGSLPLMQEVSKQGADTIYTKLDSINPTTDKEMEAWVSTAMFLDNVVLSVPRNESTQELNMPTKMQNITEKDIEAIYDYFLKDKTYLDGDNPVFTVTGNKTPELLGMSKEMAIHTLNRVGEIPLSNGRKTTNDKSKIMTFNSNNKSYTWTQEMSKIRENGYSNWFDNKGELAKKADEMYREDISNRKGLTDEEDPRSTPEYPIESLVSYKTQMEKNISNGNLRPFTADYVKRSTVGFKGTNLYRLGRSAMGVKTDIDKDFEEIKRGNIDNYTGEVLGLTEGLKGKEYDKEKVSKAINDLNYMLEGFKGTKNQGEVLAKYLNDENNPLSKNERTIALNFIAYRTGMKREEIDKVFNHRNIIDIDRSKGK